MKLLTKSVLSLLFIMGISQGCIKEDLAECIFSLNLGFEQTRICQGTSSYPEDVNRISVFAFDQAGIFVEQFTVLNPKPGPYFNMPISLPQGNYTLVTWAGITDEQLKFNNFVKGYTRINELYLSSFLSGLDGIKSAGDNLYCGIKNVTINNSLIAKQTMSLTQNTKLIRVTANGLDNSNNYQISISNNAAYYRFDNTSVPIPQPNGTTLELLREGPIFGTYTTESTLLWPMSADGPQLSIYNINTGAVIFKVAVSALLEKLPNVDFNCEPVINIKVNYLSDAQVEVSINDWKIIDFNGEI